MKNFASTSTYDRVIEEYVPLNGQIEVKDICNILNDIFFNVKAPALQFS